MDAPSLSLFDYYTAFLSVVLGLAVTDMAVSLHRLMVARRRVRWGPLAVLGPLAVFTLILAHFLRLWRGGVPMEAVSYYQVAIGTLYTLLLFLLAASSLPDEVPADGLKLEDWYMGNRGYLFGIAALLQLWDGGLMLFHIVWDHLRIGEGSTPEEWATFARFMAAAGVCGVLMRTSNRWVHGVALVALLAVAHFGYSGWVLRYPEAATTRQVEAPWERGPAATPPAPVPRR